MGSKGFIAKKSRGTQPKKRARVKSTSLFQWQNIFRWRFTPFHGEPAESWEHHLGTWTGTTEAALLKAQGGGYSIEEGAGISARGEGAQGKDFRSGALRCPALQPSPSLPGDQLPGATGRSTALAGHAKGKYSLVHLLAQNSSLHEKKPGLFSNFFCLPLPVARRRAPRCDVTGMQHRRHGDVGGRPRQLVPQPFILLTGRAKPGWSGKGPRLEVAAKL